MTEFCPKIASGFGVRLANERKRLKLSQAALAERCGIQRLAQSQYEREVSSPTLRYLALAAEAGVDLHRLLFGDSQVTKHLCGDEQYRIERLAFEEVEKYVMQQPEGYFGAEARFALFQLFKSQLQPKI
ncbi:helix-turn-helix domain-containing protein [Chitinibacter tainanensis]|uniref:helix-turn-helix domain-containing protein n=1 Tax=Chitinibacter tainanensis TaxID=230667 RepID=UPI002355C4C8|nr:helix-turn-helix transcriptional regulator [Chitinibacter tainanensis]